MIFTREDNHPPLLLCYREECRHFNISDFMDMGKTLCQSVLEYQDTQENKA